MRERLRYWNRIGWIFWGLFLLAACNPFGHAEKDVVITVGARKITTHELKRDVEFIHGGVEVARGKELKDALIEQVINYYLILEYAHEEGICVSQRELEDNLEEIREGHTERTFREALLREYVEPEGWRERLRDQLLVRKIVGEVTKNIIPPSYEEIKQYFEAHQEEFAFPEMVRFRQIVTEDKAQAEDLLNRLQGGEGMEVLARRYSTAPEAQDGGHVGWVARAHLEESMEKGLFSVPQGKIGPVIKTPYGYHIFQLLTVREGGIRDLAEVYGQIESLLLVQKREVFLRKWLKELRTRLGVKVNRELLNTVEL